MILYGSFLKTFPILINMCLRFVVQCLIAVHVALPSDISFFSSIVTVKITFLLNFC